MRVSEHHETSKKWAPAVNNIVNTFVLNGSVLEFRTPEGRKA
jgi:hypothetical protein